MYIKMSSVRRDRRITNQNGEAQSGLREVMRQSERRSALS